MSSRIPDGAFDFYVGQGKDRSYRAVAEKYGVSKRSITRLAVRENWPSRLEKIEAAARDNADKKLAETLEEMRGRHLKMLRAMAARAMEALKKYPLTSPMEGIRASEMVIKLERIIAGEPSERTTLSIEEVTRREIQDLLTAEEPGDDDEDW